MSTKAKLQHQIDALTALVHTERRRVERLTSRVRVLEHGTGVGVPGPRPPWRDAPMDGPMVEGEAHKVDDNDGRA